MLTIREAMDAFIAGWVYVRGMERMIRVSDFHGMPYLRFGSAPGLADRPDELMILERAADEVVGLARPAFGEQPYRLNVFTTTPEQAIIDYGRLGYRVASWEYLMAVDLRTATISVPDHATARRVTSEAERLWFNGAHEREVIPARAMGDERVGYYYIRLGNDLACEGRCGMTDTQIVIADSIRTAEAYRRRGLGSILMKALLTDAAAKGTVYGALVASEAGRNLYLTLGYAMLADLVIFEAERD
jgi:GNAT superfamily N-acetyltransferase